MSTTWPTVFARLTSLTVDQGYALAREPFSFDLQPDGRLDAVARLEATLEGYDGYLGGDQEERWKASVWLAAKVQRDPQGAYLDMMIAADSITAAITADEGAGDYCVGEDVTTEIQMPSADMGYLVGQITLPITIERAL